MGIKIGEQVRNFSRLLLSLAIHGGLLYFPYPKEHRSTQQSQPKPIDSVKIVTLPPTPKAIVESTPQTQTSNVISANNSVSPMDDITDSEIAQPQPNSELLETETFSANPLPTESQPEGETSETTILDRPALSESTSSKPRSEIPEKEPVEVDRHLAKKKTAKMPTQKTDTDRQLYLKNASRDFQGFLTQVFQSEEGLGREQPLRDVLQFAGDREALLVSLFCDESDEKKSEIIEFRWFSDRDPQSVYIDKIQPNLENFQLTKWGEYAGGDVYQISQSEITRYINIAPLAPNNGTLVTIWRHPPSTIKSH